MEIKLDGDAVSEIASVAIFQSMSEGTRDEVLKQAVKALLTPERSTHSIGYGKTPLQQAFEQAIRQAAFKAVQEKIAEDSEIRAKIDELMGPLLRGAIEAGAKTYNDSLTDVIGQAVGNWLAEKARGE